MKILNAYQGIIIPILYYGMYYIAYHPNRSKEGGTP